MEQEAKEIKDILDLNNPDYYNNRELSWLDFNERVLQEAVDERNPLLERLRFLAIFSSNLDEFFMIRVAELKDKIRANYNKPDNKAGLTPKQQLAAISEKARDLVKMLYKFFNFEILSKLEKQNIQILRMSDLNQHQHNYLEEIFSERIFPVLSPMAIDAYRPFPMVLNKSINLAILLHHDSEQDTAKTKFAIIKVPSVFKRFIEISEQGHRQFVLLEDVIAHFSYKLFVGYSVISTTQFRVTRDADLTIHEERTTHLLREIEKELKKRNFGDAVRLEVKQNNTDKKVVATLLKTFNIHENDMYMIDGPLDLTFLNSFYDEVAHDKEHLVYETLLPQPVKDLNCDGSIFDVVSKKDILIHHPYQSFTPVIDFLSEASENPDVLAIKQTLYRVSGDSPIIGALKRAAENGKQVTVLVELKARFEEEKNVKWAKMLERVGCDVIYGMYHLKTHSKITLVIRQREGKIERFVHLGTGNYNENTAKIYTDVGLFTSNHEFGIDATNFFNYLSGHTEKPSFYHFSTSPYDIRNKFMDLINQEIKIHQQTRNGRIIAKMNALTDKKIITKLYEASREGIQIDLIIRGICCLRPGIRGVSENIRVRSIVGRFLEHSRMFYFYHNGEEKTYLSSADWMTRNMENRVEILFPIYDSSLKKYVKDVLLIILKDNVKARIQDASGKYHYVDSDASEEEVDSQIVLFEKAYQVSECEENSDFHE
ncbi:RNA degradosome polyphosphate kinase [Aneurinibacillus terranovensis]|uniref:RNA degradosome polyphosphate kinase n=1 Tax=Aneurinibacillus terranovensis TaxID=278991 RepID=UPI000414B987|nr:RNA degradosome polyphosphate kinase [Aneurinibacillus terranovensis]